MDARRTSSQWTLSPVQKRRHGRPAARRRLTGVTLFWSPRMTGLRSALPGTRTSRPGGVRFRNCSDPKRHVDEFSSAECSAPAMAKPETTNPFFGDLLGPPVCLHEHGDGSLRNDQRRLLLRILGAYQQFGVLPRPLSSFRAQFFQGAIEEDVSDLAHGGSAYGLSPVANVRHPCGRHAELVRNEFSLPFSDHFVSHIFRNCTIDFCRHIDATLAHRTG